MKDGWGNGTGDFSCKKGAITVTVNDDGSYNVDGLDYETGNILTMDDVPASKVVAVKKEWGC